jgi:hypothetical protein
MNCFQDQDDTLKCPKYENKKCSMTLTREGLYYTIIRTLWHPEFKFNSGRRIKWVWDTATIRKYYRVLLLLRSLYCITCWGKQTDIHVGERSHISNNWNILRFWETFLTRCVTSDLEADVIRSRKYLLQLSTFSPTFVPPIFMHALIKMAVLMEKLVEQASWSNFFHHSGTTYIFII